MGRSHQTCSIDMKGRGNRGEEAARSVLLVLDLEEGSYGGYALTLWLLWALLLGHGARHKLSCPVAMPQTLSSFLALGILSVCRCFQTAWLVRMLRTRASVTQCFLSRVLSTFIYEWVSSQSLFIAPQPPGAYPFGHGGRLSALWGGRARDSVTCKVLQGSGKTLKEKISQAVLQKMS